MAPEHRERRGLLWLPVLVAGLGLLLSGSGWAFLVRERREQVQEMAAQVAAQSRRTVSARVWNHVAALQNLAGFWAAVGRRPVAEWRADAEMLIESHPNLEYIAWIHADGRRARVASGRYESPEAVDIEPREAKRLGTTARLIGPERADTGAPMLRVLLPVGQASSDLGVLESRIQLRPFLQETLEESAPGYAIRILWGDQEIFLRGEPRDQRRHRWWREEGPIPLPLGATWTAVYAPTAELAAAWLDPTPHYLLAAGVALSILLGFMTHQLRLSSWRARALSAGNVALEASAWELRRLNEALEERVSERTQELEAFTHSISHDLKSPLGAILNFSAILELDYQEQLDLEGREVIQRIRSSAQRGTELLEGLLRLSRAGHADLQYVRIDMNELARECFALARESHRAPDAEFALEPLPCAIGDETLVREVLVNLFDNALKYSRDREKPRVGMRARVENGQCVYEVEDNGQGFDMRFSEKLFGLFQRLPSSYGIEGTGVGLALVARIVHRHGGEVSAEGRVGEGTKIMFTLPASGLAHE